MAHKHLQAHYHGRRNTAAVEKARQMMAMAREGASEGRCALQNYFFRLTTLVLFGSHYSFSLLLLLLLPLSISSPEEDTLLGRSALEQ